MRVSLCTLRPGHALARASMSHLPCHTDKAQHPLLAGVATTEEVAEAEQAAKTAWAALKGAWGQRSEGGASDAGAPASAGTQARTQAGTDAAGSSGGSRSGGLQTLAAAAASAGQAKPAPVQPAARKLAVAKPSSKPPPAKPQQRAPAGQPSLFGGQFGFTRSVEHRGQLQELPPVQPFVGHLPCPEPTCAERFDRLTALRSHVRHKHSGLPVPPRGHVKEGAAGEGSASSGDEGDSDLTSEDEAGACC